MKPWREPVSTGLQFIILNDTACQPGIPYEEFYKLKYCSTVVYMVPRA